MSRYPSGGPRNEPGDESPPGGGVKRWLFEIVAVVVVGPIYCVVIASGLREIVPALGQKLYKLPIPGFTMFGDYVGTRRLDLAIGMAVILLFSVCWLWERILFTIMSPDEAFADAGWDPEAYRRVVLTLGTVILLSDGLLFYYAVTQTGWGGGGFSFTALIATAAYVAVIVFISLVSLNLRRSAGR